MDAGRQRAGLKWDTVPRVRLHMTRTKTTCAKSAVSMAWLEKETPSRKHSLRLTKPFVSIVDIIKKLSFDLNRAASPKRLDLVAL